MNKIKFIRFVVGFVHLSMIKNKLFAPKLDNLLKHESCHKAKVSMLGVDAKGSFFNKDFIPVKNELYYTTANCPSVLDHL
jgi:hypothetical protein